ncbi:hypothetical protein HG531_010592 [Fusarium graminearum]|nr:hypothetical protein HG531_010592 [Fusarium graminearum]
MSDLFDWDRDDEDDAKRDFKAAMVKQFNDIYGTDPDNLENWQKLCHVLNIEPAPTSLEACRERVRRTHVNLVDLVETANTGLPVQAFKNLKQLQDYTVENGRFFPKDSAYHGGLLRFLLRQIFPENIRVIVLSHGTGFVGQGSLSTKAILRGRQETNFECETCDRYFNDKHAVEQHMSALNHWADSPSEESDYSSYICEFDFCDEELDTADDLRNHEINDHLYCDPCDRSFKDLNSIKMHLRSRVHQGETQHCPFCGQSYVTAAGVFQHLENKGCSKAPLNRAMVYEAVRSRDPNGTLTKKLLDWSKSIRFEATGRSLNAVTGAFDCSLCGASFNRLQSLTQHLQSPKHEQKLYHCPKKGCDRRFTTLAAVTSHLESEQCGFMRFEDVQEVVSRIFDPGRMIAF